MSMGHQLTFAATPVSIVLSLIAIGIAGALGYHAWRRSGYAKSIAMLEGLRLLIIAFVVVLLNQPEWTEQYRPDVRPTIAVLYDDSPSMQTIDVLPADANSRQAVSRAEAVRPLTDPSAWSGLSDRLDVMVEPLGPRANDQTQLGRQANDQTQVGRQANDQALVDDASGRTNLSQPLTDVAERMDSLLGVVLISDGDWNEGAPPVEAASRFRARNIPIFTVAAGSTSRLPDVELLSADVPTFGSVGKPVRIPITIDSSLPREYLTTVTLQVADGETITKDVRVAPMSRTYDAVIWKPESTGDYTLELSIPTHEEETIATNNRLQAPIAIRQEQLKVLIVESYPRWEYRYLRNALSRDPGVEVACLLFHPGLEKVGGGSQDYIKVFPEEIEDLTQYDVVFLGDVGLDDGQLTESQCELIKGLVEHQASGLFFMPGLQGRQFTLLDTTLADLYPVLMDPAQPTGWGSRIAGHFELTERGRISLLTKLADSPEENVEVWEDLPGFQWYAPVVRAKAGSEILAVHQDMSNQYGRLPLLVTRTFGAGKVLFMGTDGAWRWRKGVEDKYHYRFWGQVVRWMAYQRNMAEGETMRLFYTPDQPQIRQSISLNAHVMDDRGEPLQQGEVSVRIVAPSGASETVRMQAEGDRWGVFQGRFLPEEPGTHRVTVVCRDTSGVLETSFFVQGQIAEQVGKPARPDVLEEVSLVSRGRSVSPDQIGEVIDALAELPLPPPTVRRLQLWSHPLCGAMLVLLLGIFWVWRKAVGLI